jgi:transcription factor SFP1
MPSFADFSQCDFAIHDAVDLGLTIEEAEERARPFVCAVGAGCLRRYRQLNGLKVSSFSSTVISADYQYHYLNSGEHGQYGLRMLQNGTHPAPASTTGSTSTTSKTTPSTTTSKPATPSTTTTATTTPSTINPVRRPIPSSTATPTASAAAASTASRPYHIPSQIGATRPRMGVFPTNPTTAGRGPVPGNGMSGLAGIGRAGVPVRPGIHSASAAVAKPTPPVQLPPIQRGRDAVLFAAVETMDL